MIPSSNRNDQLSHSIAPEIIIIRNDLDDIRVHYLPESGQYEILMIYYSYRYVDDVITLEWTPPVCEARVGRFQLIGYK